MAFGRTVAALRTDDPFLAPNGVFRTGVRLPLNLEVPSAGIGKLTTFASWGFADTGIELVKRQPPGRAVQPLRIVLSAPCPDDGPAGIIHYKQAPCQMPWLA